MNQPPFPPNDELEMIDKSCGMPEHGTLGKLSVRDKVPDALKMSCMLGFSLL